MLNIGPQELIVVLIVALLVVGPQRLPELSRQIGRGLREFRKLQEDVKGIVDIDQVKRDVTGMVRFDDAATETRRPSPSSAGAGPAVHRTTRPATPADTANGQAANGQAASPPATPAADAD